MEKKQIIDFIEQQLSIGGISKNDLIDIAQKGHPASYNSSGINQVKNDSQTGNFLEKENNSQKMTNILYVIGAIIALIGVIILIVQNWEQIGFAGRIIVTLGISLCAYILGLVLKGPENRILSQVMFVISTCLAPIGSIVFLTEANVELTMSIQIILTFIFTIFFGLALFISQRNILLIVTTGFASAFYYSVLVKMFETVDGFNSILKFATIVLGIAFFFIGLGYSFFHKSLDQQDEKEKKSVQNIMYGLGVIAILGSVMFMNGAFKDLILIALIFGVFYASVYLKSRLVLMLGAIFLVIHIIMITSKYFIDSLGWPISLIGAGFLVIAVGYLSFYLSKNYISQKK